jgi:phospholipase/carboxylesterase
MKTIETTLHHRVLMPDAKGRSKHPTLILLHGRGADEEDLLGIVPMLDERFLVISPRAPYVFPAGGGYTWYDIVNIGDPDPAMFVDSCNRLTQFVDDVLAGYPADPSRLFLFGFSMGTVMSYTLALTRPDRFRGVAANSGYVPEGTHLEFQWDRLEDTAFFVTHGTMDPIIPVSFARRAQKMLASSRASLTYREYPIGHQLSDEGVRDVSAWLTHLV